MRPRSPHIVPLLGIFLAWSVLAQTISDPFAEGRRLFEEKKYEEALAKFQKSLEYLPHDPTILSWVGASQLSLSRFAEAEQSLTEAVDRGGTSYQFFELLAASQARQAKWDAALGTVKRYREVGPEVERKENEEKLRALDVALHLEKRGECLRRDPPEHPCADTALEAAWQLGANDPAHAATFAQVWLSHGVSETEPARKGELLARAETASRVWVAAAGAAEANRARVFLGTTLVRERKFEEAAGVLEEARTAEPSNCSVKLELARAYLGRENYPKVKAAASEAITCKPEDAIGYFLRASAEFGLEECPAVVKDGAEYLKRVPPGKEEPKFVKYCKSVLESQRAQADQQEYKKQMERWVRQQLEEGDRTVEETLLKPKKKKTPDKENGKGSEKSDDKESVKSEMR